MQKNLIINGDDLGLSAEVSLGIEKSYREGILSSATLMANMLGFKEGVQVALRNPDLGIGVHLNIIRGKPISDQEEVHPLLGDNGNFIDNIYQIGRLSANPDFQKSAEIEYRAQIERVLDSGVKPDHLDFEKHHGIWRNLYDIGTRLAKEYKLAIRCFNEPLFFAIQNLPFAGYRNLWYSLHLKCYNKFFHKNISTPMPDYFFGQTHIGSIDKEFLIALINNLPHGTSELMTHPGFNTPSDRENSLQLGESWITKKREGELAALIDPEVIKALKDSDIILTTFRECFF